MDFNRLIPELAVRDIEKSLHFYTLLGFSVEYQRDEFVMISLQGSQIMLEHLHDNWITGPMDPPFGRGVNLQMEVESIRPLLDVLRKKNYPLFREPATNWYQAGSMVLGNREFLVQDPDGYLLRFFEDAGEKRT